MNQAIKIRPFSRPTLMLFIAAASFLFVAARQFLWNGSSLAPASQVVSAVEPASESNIARLQNFLATNPENANGYAQLGLAYLQRVRETGDPAYYTLAEQTLNQALAYDPQQLDALMGQGVLALARHDFAGALTWAEQARVINPYRAEILGIMVDAYVELGQYETAVSTLQQMVDLRPDMASFSRVSYLRELHGDVPGAIEAMQRAVDTGVPGYEATLWAQVQLGNLYFYSGQFAQAEAIYQQALYYRPDYPYAQAGLARVQAAQGNYEAAIAIYKPLVARFPLPEFAIALGELYEAMGQPDLAQEQYALVQTIQQLNASAGMDVDMELALFEANHGSNPAETAKQAEVAYTRRPSVYAADVLAWALYQAGEYERAWQYSQEALRLGTQDAMLHYHAGLIARAVGEETAVSSHLQTALTINPAFSPLYAPQAQALLAEMGH